MSTQGIALAGSLAATLQAAEVYKLVAGEREHSIAGSEVLFDARHQVHLVSRLTANPTCRFSHERWSLCDVDDLTLEAAFQLVPGPLAHKSLFVPDHAFASRLGCLDCVREEQLLHLRESLDVFSLACPGCGQPREIRGIDLVDRLLGAQLAASELQLSLTQLGLRRGEVFGVEGEGGEAAYFVLGAAKESGVSIVVAGLGNIGSFIAPHLARIAEIDHVVLCDPDHYEVGQPLGQDLPEDAVGRGKAEVQAERMRAIRPDMSVEAFATSVEALPLGVLRDSIVVSCLDTRVARLRLAARAWRVGSPFVDAAVGGGSSLLVRTNVYLPDSGAACFECAFEPSDYAQLEQIFPCEGARSASQQTTASHSVLNNEVSHG